MPAPYCCVCHCFATADCSALLARLPALRYCVCHCFVTADYSASLQRLPLLRCCVCQRLAVTHGHHPSRYCSWQQCSSGAWQLEEGSLDRSTLLEQLLH